MILKKYVKKKENSRDVFNTKNTVVTGEYGFDLAIDEDEKYNLIIKGYEEGNFDEYWKKIEEKVTKKKLSEEFKDLYIKMVASDKDKRPEIKEILEHKWFKEIESCEEQIEKDVREYLGKIYGYINGKICPEIGQAKEVGSKFNTKGYGDNFEKAKNVFNNTNLKPKYISINRENFNLGILIESYLDEIKFMKALYEEINTNENFKDISIIEASSESFVIIVDFVNYNNKGEDFKIIIELLKYQKDEKNEKEGDRYLVELIRKGGSVPDYFKYFLVIREIIKKIIN